VCIETLAQAAYSGTSPPPPALGSRRRYSSPERAPGVLIILSSPLNDLGRYSGALILILAGAVSFMFSRRALDSSNATSRKDRYSIDIANFNRRLGRCMGLVFVAVGIVVLVLLVAKG